MRSSGGSDGNVSKGQPPPPSYNEILLADKSFHNPHGWETMASAFGIIRPVSFMLEVADDDRTWGGPATAAMTTGDRRGEQGVPKKDVAVEEDEEREKGSQSWFYDTVRDRQNRLWADTRIKKGVELARKGQHQVRKTPWSPKLIVGSAGDLNIVTKCCGGQGSNDMMLGWKCCFLVAGNCHTVLPHTCLNLNFYYLTAAAPYVAVVFLPGAGAGAAESLTLRIVVLVTATETTDRLVRKLAIDTYSQALGMCPDHEDGLVARGAAFATMGRLRQALQDLSRALSLNPNNENASSYLKETRRYWHHERCRRRTCLSVA